MQYCVWSKLISVFIHHLTTWYNLLQQNVSPLGNINTQMERAANQTLPLYLNHHWSPILNVSKALYQSSPITGVFVNNFFCLEINWGF
jgi:hypothetical protein